MMEVRRKRRMGACGENSNPAYFSTGKSDQLLREVEAGLSFMSCCNCENSIRCNMRRAW